MNFYVTKSEGDVIFSSRHLYFLEITKFLLLIKSKNINKVDPQNINYFSLLRRLIFHYF